MLSYDHEKERWEKSLIELRHDLHRHPELSHQEVETTRRLAAEMRALGIEVVDLGLPTGLVGRLRGGQTGRTVAVRADIDALPIEEQNDVPYRSTVTGVMHACGHDIHASVAVGAAKMLASVKEKLKGDVLFLFQPAEEVNDGAQLMIDRGVFDRFSVDVVLGLHNNPTIPAGQIAIHSGGLMASVDTLRFRVIGKGGHGAIPHATRDPVVAACAMVMNLQSIVSRNVSPLESAVISIGHIQAGKMNNIIPEEVSMTGTVRSFTEKNRRLLHDRIYEVLEGTARAMDVKVEIEYIFHLPPVFNPPELARFYRDVIIETMGKERVVDPVPSMGGEDFALFMERVPGFYFWLGVGNKEKGITNVWHNDRFDGDDTAIFPGAFAMAQMVIHSLHSM